MTRRFKIDGDSCITTHTDKLECVWASQDFESTYYETSCGHLFEFTADSPKENNFRFCPFCGGRLEVEPVEEDDDDE